MKHYTYPKRVGKKLEKIQQDIKAIELTLSTLRQNIDNLFLDVIAKEVHRKEEDNGRKKR